VGPGVGARRGTERVGVMDPGLSAAWVVEVVSLVSFHASSESRSLDFWSAVGSEAITRVQSRGPKPYPDVIDPIDVSLGSRSQEP